MKNEKVAYSIYLSKLCCCFSLFPSPPLLPGPEFGTEEDCIFVSMVTEDVDVSELVDTIAALGRDIEESGRVTTVLF